MEQEHDIESRLKVINSFPQRMLFAMEPWGSTFWVDSGDVVEVIAKGPAGGGLELALGTDAIEVWSWTGSTVAVYHNGERLGPALGEQPRVPAYPQAQTWQVDSEKDD